MKSQAQAECLCFFCCMMLNECLPTLGKELLNEIEEHSTLKTFSSGEYVVRQGEAIRFLPVVTEGNIKVFSTENSLQFLLYYISSGGTCIFSFAHLFHDEPISFSATAETDSKVLLLPLHKTREWYEKYTRFGHLLLNGYQKHYDDLLLTTKEIICNNLESRLLAYFHTKAEISNTSILKITHQEIAQDLGTSREVITRLMTKPTIREHIIQSGRKIKVL